MAGISSETIVMSLALKCSTSTDNTSLVPGSRWNPWITPGEAVNIWPGYNSTVVNERGSLGSPRSRNDPAFETVMTRKRSQMCWCLWGEIPPILSGGAFTTR